MKRRVLFLGKAQDRHCLEALAFTASRFSVEAALGDWGDPFPDLARDWDGDLIVSYLSRWIAPGWLIDRGTLAAINFHPASPDYPGIGCTNFALYDEAAEYGVTCHFMAPAVDTGPIIATCRFPIVPDDDVASLLARAYDCQLDLFVDVMARVAEGETLVPNGEQWARSPYTRAEFDRLGTITADMSAQEVRRRVRATSFGRWQPRIEVAGHVFTFAGEVVPAAPVQPWARQPRSGKGCAQPHRAGPHGDGATRRQDAPGVEAGAARVRPRRDARDSG